MSSMNWKTTLAACIAAVMQAITAVGALPHPWSTIAQLIGAAALALLGYSATDKQPTKPLASPKSLN